MTLFVVAVEVEVVFVFLSARVSIDVGESVLGTQLDGTVVAVVAWCCVLPLLFLM